MGAAAFTYIATLFARVYVRLKSDELLANVVSFTLLALSQACGAASAITPEGQWAATLYVATSSLAAASFAVMLLQTTSAGTYILIPTLVITPDLLAGLLSSILTISRARGGTRSLLSLMSLSYYVRGLSVLLSAAHGSLLTLLISETMRAAVAVLLSIHHTAKVLPHGEEEV